MILQILITMVAGWINRHQQQLIIYLKAENRVLKSKLSGDRLRLTDTERRRPAALAFALGRKQIKDTASIATPDTFMRWYKRLIAGRFDGRKKRKERGRPRVDEEIELLVMRMTRESPTWGYRRIQGALANLGHSIDKIIVRNILRRYHIDPAPKRRQA
jgi:putative transposase